MNYGKENIKIFYIITTNYTKLFANTLKEYFKAFNIRCVIYSDIYDTLIEKCNNNPNLYLFFIGTIHLINNNITELPKDKYIIYQIEQLNQNIYYYHKLTPELIVLMDNAYALYDYSIINLNYYPEIIKNKVQLLDPTSCLIENDVVNFKELKELKEIKKPIANPIPIDILFIGTLNARRKNILDRLKSYNYQNALNYTIVIVEKVFDNKLIELLKHTKIVLNLHYYDNAILEVFRFHDIMLIPNKCKIISEYPGLKEEYHLINKYKNVAQFFPVLNEKNKKNNDLKTYSEMFNLIYKEIISC